VSLAARSAALLSALLLVVATMASASGSGGVATPTGESSADDTNASANASTKDAAPQPAAGPARWGFARDPFDVDWQGEGDDAMVLAQRLLGLDEAMRRLLRLPKGASSPPTRVVALDNAELAALDPVWASQGGAYFSAAPFDDYLVLASDHGSTPAAALRADRQLGLLADWGLARLPDWYRQGLAQLAAGAVFGSGTITIGQDADEQLLRLLHGWFPIEKILRLPASDPEFQGNAEDLALYHAECWWIVHLLLVERVLDPAVAQYVERIMVGQDQAVAYAVSFNAPYEQIDEYFRQLRRKVSLTTFVTELPPARAEPGPRPLDGNAWQALRAELAVVRDGRSALGLRLAREVLAADPDNETALLALARTDLAAQRFTECNATVQRLHARADLTPDARRTLAGLELQLALHKENALPGTQDFDARKFRALARADYQHALDANPTDVRALYQLGWLESTDGDVAGVRVLLPAVEAAYNSRPDSPALAGLLVRMNSIAGTPAEVFKYSVAEQRLAVTEAERASAAARVARMRPQLKTPQ
jgi:hypothetical protein